MASARPATQQLEGTRPCNRAITGQGFARGSVRETGPASFNSEEMMTQPALKANDQPSLLHWMRENLDSIPKDMLYRKAAIDQMVFFRDRIAPLFLKPDTPLEERDSFVTIAGWHRSKSVTLPVYVFKTDSIEVVARDNFYNWNVTVISKFPIVFPDYFEIDNGNGYLFMEGMESWKRGPYASNQSEFSFCVWDDYQLFAVMWCIASQHREPTP